MQTDFPTVELYFCFAFTLCRLRVYKTEEQFTRRLIEMSPGIELLKSSDSKSWHEVDTRVLMAIVSKAFLVERERLSKLKNFVSQI
jgi:hypothetical protein